MSGEECIECGCEDAWCPCRRDETAPRGEPLYGYDESDDDDE